MKKGFSIVGILGCVFLLGITLLLGIIIVAAVNEKPKAPTVELQPGGSNRFEIALVSVVKDNLAYGNKRGIYILKDTQTGEEFIGISGVGISSLGKHGKSSQDER